MRIAVASEDEKVTGHFGHCKNFNIFETEADRIISHQSTPSPEHKPGYLPKLLADQGVQVIIAGSMGERAIKLFGQHKIEVFVGIKGEAEAVVNQYLAGTLVSDESVCREHHHHRDHHGE